MDQRSQQNGSFLGNSVFLIVTVAFWLGAIPMVLMQFGPVLRSLEARDWVAHDAVLIRAGVDQPYPKQYLLLADYKYIWNGTEHLGSKVFFDEMVGVRRSYYHQIRRELNINAERGNTLQIWVDPNKPTDAVIFRHVRWDKFLGNGILFSIWALITTALTLALRETFKK